MSWCWTLGRVAGGARRGYCSRGHGWGVFNAHTEGLTVRGAVLTLISLGLISLGTGCYAPSRCSGPAACPSRARESGPHLPLCSGSR